MSDSPPLIVRISGIPVDVLTGFSSPDCLEAAHRLSVLQERSEVARAALVEQLHTVIQNAPPDQRRYLLALKRDSFNGRDLLGYRNPSRWSHIAESTLAVEEELEQGRRELLEIYESQRDREQQHLKALVGEPSMLRGLAFGSPEFLMNLPRFLRASPRSGGRRERRLELSSLRYVSRAAIKLSPFSSLTPIGLARLDPNEESLRFNEDHEWSELSRVHLQRFLVEQIAGLLMNHGSFRAGLKVELNPTIERLGGNVCRFLRPGSWICPPGKDVLEWRQPSLVRAKLGGTVLDSLLAEPPDRLAGGSLDRLLETGLLCFELPWTRPVVASETLLMEYLDQIEDDSLEPLRADLRYVVGSLRSGEIAESRVRVKKILEEASSLVGRRLEIEDARKEWMFHEDVFLTSGGPKAEILRAPGPKIRKMLDDLGVLVRLSNLGHGRFDFLHTLGGFAASRWPAAEEVGFLEFFEAAFPIYRQYTAFERETRLEWPLRRKAFNPMGLREIEELRRHRESAAQALDGCLRDKGLDKGTDAEIDLDRAREILSAVPEPYAEPRDFAVFVQAVPPGDVWVLNSIVEGAGRFESRYTMVMPPEVRQEWSDRYEARSIVDRGAEIVDLFSPMNNTADLHVPLTRRVVEFPGQPTDLPSDRRLPLRELRVRFEGAARLPWLVDGRGRRILPSHLGALGFRFLPAVHRFLALFGASDLRRCFPVRDWRQEGDVRVRGRHWIGNLAYRRRTWDCELASLKAAVAGRSDAAAFQTISQWRQARGLPDRVFVADHKPQYIDFTSCLFVELFRTILEKDIDRLEIVEALPGPEDGLPRACGGRWAAELLLDAHGLAPGGNMRHFL